jgi:hypothetical protein
MLHHLVFFNFLGGATEVVATASIGGTMTHGGIYAFFDGFSETAAPDGEVAQNVRLFHSNVGRFMNP